MREINHSASKTPLVLVYAFDMILSTDIPTSSHSKRSVEYRCDGCNNNHSRRYDGLLTSRKKHAGRDLCRACTSKEHGFRQRGTRRSAEVRAKLKKAVTEHHIKNHPSFDIKCKVCEKPMTVPYARRPDGPRPTVYCSRDCQWKGHDNPNEGNDSRRQHTCIVCKKPFKTYSKDAIVCGRDCLADYMSIARRGRNNPAYKENKEKGECLTCGTTFTKDRNGIKAGRIRLFCSAECSHVIDLRGRSINQPGDYPRQWNEEFKEEIKTRDNHRCALCDARETERGHHVHHIDYNKHNLDHTNLITLCQGCHNMTHSGRSVWQDIFMHLSGYQREISESCIRLLNNSGMLEYLILRKRTSLVLHNESLIGGYVCSYGQAKCVPHPEQTPKAYVLYEGDSLDIEPQFEYHLTARLNTILKPCLKSSPSLS